MTLHLPNQIEPLTPADAAEVEHNNTHLVDYINTELISRDGAVAMTSPLQLSGDPTSDNHAARKGYVDSLLPVGTMMMYGSTVAPAGRWRVCDGSALSTTAFPKLFAVLQYAYGGSGSTFNLPDLRHRVPIGVDSADARFNAVGKVGGSYDAALLEHFHAIDHNHASFMSGTQSSNHVHSIAHDHASVDSADEGVTVKFTNVHVDSVTPPSAFALTTTASPSTVGQGTDLIHDHAVNLPNYTGNSGNNTTNHSHAVDIPAFAGSSGNKGTAAAQQIPPFVTISYIIRTD
ncbi:MAG TPA: phage tail protein [Actinomycetes bacterium]|nr:phage tail protein [Actinomycetes bacterium]